MILLTTNVAKFAPFGEVLRELGISLSPPRHPLEEFQAETVRDAATRKARSASRSHGSAVMIDDAGLLLAAHTGFPGAMTRHALATLSRDAWRGLVRDDNRAEMVCVLAWSDGTRVRSWQGHSLGRLDPRRPEREHAAGLLSSWFIPDDGQPLQHRARALQAYRQEREDAGK